MATALLYNLTGHEKLPRIIMTLFRLGITGREVSPGEYSLPIGTLLGLDAAAEPEDEAESFTDEMLVLYDLTPLQFNGLLQQLRQTRATVALKAVVTEHNVNWSSGKLHREIAAEHAAMAAMNGGIHQNG